MFTMTVRPLLLKPHHVLPPLRAHPLASISSLRLIPCSFSLRLRRLASIPANTARADYMYGGGYMLGTDMMMFGMLYGASDMAYYDHQSYGGDYGMDEGFDADGGFGMDDGDDFDFD